MPIEERSNVEDTEQGITVSLTEHVSLEVEPGETSCIISENVGTEDMAGHDHEQSSVVQGTDRESMTEMSMRYKDALEQECLRKSSVASISARTAEWSEAALKSDDKVKFYKGLPSFIVLMSVLKLVSIHSHNSIGLFCHSLRNSLLRL